MRIWRFLALISIVFSSFTPASATTQNDAGTGEDASDSFGSPTILPVSGWFDGRLEQSTGDNDDFYGFEVPEGRAFSVLVMFSAASTDPVELLDPNGNVVDTGVRFASLGVAGSNALTAASAAFSPSNEQFGVRLAVHRALTGGVYRLHIQTRRFAMTTYSMCVMNCDEVMSAPTDLIFGGSLENLDTKVLLVPPTHGDLGNPFGPNVLDYIDATVRGVRKWETSMDAFATKYPEYWYLRQIEISIEIFDEVNPVDPAGYDVVIGYVAAGPAFRGVAADSQTGDLQRFMLGAHYSGRYIALSLFGSAPRAGQVAYDFPELTDLEIVTTHEFGHTFGLGHTRTWHPVLGGDLMNSPASFVYGDGSPVGDGGERTPLQCLSSLNLYGMAELYSWVPSLQWQPSGGSRDLPENMPYEWFC